MIIIKCDSCQAENAMIRFFCGPTTESLEQIDLCDKCANLAGIWKPNRDWPFQALHLRSLVVNALRKAAEGGGDVEP